jgi:hypothetical protein
VSEKIKTVGSTAEKNPDVGMAAGLTNSVNFTKIR